MSKHVTLDCRGLSCPGPVLRVIDVLEKGAPETLEVQVDDQAAQENVTRLLTGKGFTVTAEEGPGRIVLKATRGTSAQAGASPQPQSQEKTVAFITADSIGRGNDELGGKLMLAFLATLPELGTSLWRIVLVNGGVKLACESHPALEKLEALAASGVSILVCGTCLNFFELMDKKRVGETTNMLDVVTSLGLAGKIIQV